MEALSKRYGRKTVLEQVDLVVEQGEIVCVIGPNGSGKSTLLSICAGTLRPDGGAAYYRGRSPGGACAGEIAYIPQQDTLFADLTVRDNLLFWSEAAGRPLKEALALPQVRELELEGLLRQRVGRLSGGMRRRVALATALLSSPALLLLDEPFAGLDFLYKELLINQLKGLGGGGTAILYTSHNTDEIAPLCHRFYVLSAGRIRRQADAGSLPEPGDALRTYFHHMLTEGSRNHE